MLLLARFELGRETLAEPSMVLAGTGSAAGGPQDVVPFAIVGRRRGFSGSAAGTSTTSADLDRTRGLVGSSDGTASTSGSLDRTRGLKGSATGTASTSGVLSLERELTGSAAGTASTSGSLDRTRGFKGSATGTASTSGGLSLSRRLQGLAAAAAVTVAGLSLTRGLQGASAGLASTSGTLTVADLRGSATGQAGASGSLSLTRGFAGSATGVAITEGSLRRLAGEAIEFMLQRIRIQNALVGVAKSGSFFPISYDPDTGLASADETKLIAPSQVLVNETEADFNTARLNRRSLVRERIGWVWQMEIAFAQEVACEAFEDLLSLTPHRIEHDPDNGLRGVILELVSSEYSHPPMQQASSGSSISFTFQATLTPV